MAPPLRTCYKCQKDTLECLKSTQYSTNYVPNGESYQYQCQGCGYRCEIFSSGRLLALGVLLALMVYIAFMLGYWLPRRDDDGAGFSLAQTPPNGLIAIFGGLSVSLYVLFIMLRAFENERQNPKV